MGPEQVNIEKIMTTPKRSNACRQRRGATLMLICILMVVLVGIVAFGVDAGRIYLVRSQLQSAVDSGALAASLQLKTDPNDIDAAVAAANDFVQHNRVGWLVTVPEDVIVVDVGTWDTETNTFVVGDDEPDSVRVAARVDDEPLFFARVLGQSEFSVPRAAIASAGGGKLDIVMALDLSGSMGDNGRIQALRKAAPEFVDVFQEGDDARIGVMCYGAEIGEYDPVAEGHGGSLYVAAPQNLYPSGSDWVGVLEAGLTKDLKYLRNHVLHANTLKDSKYGGWTPTGAALRDSAHYLEENARDNVNKIVVLMSDGYANKPDGNGAGYARSMATYAKGLDIKVYTISLGDSADVDLMQDIADLTGGEHFQASGSAAELSETLTEAFQGVAGELRRTQLVK